MGALCSGGVKSRERTISQEETQENLVDALGNHQQFQKEINFLAGCTYFDHTTLNLLYKRFQTIDGNVNNDELIAVEELAKVLHLGEDNLVIQRIFNIFSSGRSKHVNFRNFVMALSKLSMKASLEEKIRISFDFYDVDGSGTIERVEMMDLMQNCLSQTTIELTEEQLNQICQNTFDAVDENHDARIQFEEYSNFVKSHENVIQPFYINVQSIIDYDFEENRKKRKTLDRNLSHGPLTSPDPKPPGAIRQIFFTNSNDDHQVVTINSPEDLLRDI